MKHIKILLGIIFFAFLFQISNSQETQSDKTNVFEKLAHKEPDKGTITITQSPKIEELITRHFEINAEDKTIDGWRIQIYNSSGKEAREEANDIREKFLNRYPEMKAYLIYQPPFFKIRIGDYRSKQDAFEQYINMVRQYPVSYLVPDKINFPDLEK